MEEVTIGKHPVSSHATSPTDKSPMVDIEMARLVVLGEASLLTTALLKCHHSHHTYYYGSRGGLATGLKQSMSLPNRLAFAVAVENEEDEDDFLDDTFGIISDPSNGSPSSSVHHPLPTDPILKNLIRLKGKLRKGSRSSFNVTTDPSYLIPFCEVIKNKDTSGPITGMALQSILKFINYDLVSHTETLGSVQLIGDSVTKARFIGTDTSSDEVVLMRILDVLKQLIIRGYKSLSNETICEIMQSSFRIAFEPRLSELLRKNAEQALLDMVRCLFRKLKHYNGEEVAFSSGLIKSGSGVKMPSGFGKKKEKMYQSSITERMEINSSANPSPTNETGPPVSGDGGSGHDQLVKSMSDASLAESVVSDNGTVSTTNPESIPSDSESTKPNQDAPQQAKNRSRGEPHGIECINELLCYMTTLTSPLPESQNSESMINIGLNLLIIAFESAITDIGNKSCLLKVIKNDLCFNMIQLLQSSRPLTSFALTLRLSFLIFTALRHLLKYQMEMLFTRLKELITTGNAPIEYRELSLEYLVGYFRHLPSLSHELFFNYDLDPYASNLLEDLYQFFSKNCFSSSSPNDPSVSVSGTSSPGSASFSPIQLLSLDAFLTNLNSLHRAELCKEVTLIPGSEIDDCSTTPVNEVQSPPGDRDIGLSESPQPAEPTFESKKALINPYPKTLLEIEHLKQRKRMLWMASDQFNQKPAKGIQFLKDNGLVADEKEIASFLRDNSKLDKKMLGEYLSHKNSPVTLNAFIDTFNLKGQRLDEALRLYLETFRLPGEAPLVSNLLEPFAIHWHVNNGSPFENNDAAYTLSYAIIMLNVDQHNVNVKRQTPSMTCKQFINNLRQVNGGKDFDPKMLTQIYEAIKTKEIVMPAEHHGPVRDKYLWKCLLGRSETSSGIYWFSDFKGSSGQVVGSRRPSMYAAVHAIPLHLLNNQLFSTLWGPAIAAMTFVFDKININHNSNLTQRILNNGFSSCALLCSSYGHLDNLIVILCKFTLSSNAGSNNSVSSSVGNNAQPLLSHKSQMAAQTLFGILREYSNYMRESWSNIVEILLHWFKSGFLDDLLEVDDFALNTKLKMKRKMTVKSNKNTNESSSTFLSSFYMYFAGSNPDIDVEGTRSEDGNSKSSSGVTGDGSLSGPSSLTAINALPENLINKYCQPLSLVEESRFLHIDSLLELIKALMNVQVEVVDETGDDIEAFRMELLVQITLLNRDRASVFWPQLSNFLIRALKSSADSEPLSERVISAIFRLAIRFVPRIDTTSDQIMILLRHILMNCEPSFIQKKCTAVALTSFINSCHRDIRKVDDWSLIFDYLLCVGIGCHPSELPVRQSLSPGPTEEEEEKPEKIPPPTSHVPSIPQGPPVPSVQIQIEDDIPEEVQPVIPSAPPLEQQSNQDISQQSFDGAKPLSSSVETDNLQQVPKSPDEKRKIGPSDGNSSSLQTQPFVPGSSSVQDVEAYQKCVEILTVIIKEILPKSVQTNPKSDAAINQMAIDSLITLRYYSVQDESLRKSVTTPSGSNI